MTKEDLKEYKYNKQYIKDRLEFIEEYRNNLNKLTNTLSNMPKRKQTGRRQYGREVVKIIRFSK